MAESFRKIVNLPPLRVTVQQVAERADELVAQMNCGGKVDAWYDVSFEDGTSFERGSSSDFLANLDSEGERLARVSVTINAWSPAQPPALLVGDIVRTVRIDLRDFGSDLYVFSSDPWWGKGAIDSIKARFSRYSPWYGRLHKWIPAFSGILTPLPFLFVAVAVLQERKLTALLAAVVVLSLVLFIGNAWFWRQYMKRRWLAHTVIFRTRRRRDWAWLKVLVGAITLVANVATVAAILLR